MLHSGGLNTAGELAKAKPSMILRMLLNENIAQAVTESQNVDGALLESALLTGMRFRNVGSMFLVSRRPGGAILGPKGSAVAA